MLFKSFLQVLIILWSALAFAYEMKVNVKVVEVTSSDLYDTYQGVGESIVSASHDFYAKSPGTVTYITKKQGEQIAVGEVILEINGPLAHAMYEKAETSFKSADFSYRKDQNLIEKKFISEESFKKSKLNLETAKYELEKAKQEFSEMVITAPFDGKVGVAACHIGNNVSTGDYLVSITSGNDMELIVHLPEKLIDKVMLNTKVQVLLEHAEPLEGKIIAVSPHVSRESGNFIVKIASDTSVLKHGSYAKVKFFLNPHNGLVVPEKSVQKNEKGSFVFALDENAQAKQIYVTTGTRLGSDVEIITGLVSGQKIVVEGLTNLNDGANINIME